MNIAARIDHTLLRADTMADDIAGLCKEALGKGFATVCVPPYYVREAAGALRESGVGVCTVIGFPLGYHLSSVKSTEAELAIISGADELDMVVNIAALKSGNRSLLETEVRDLLEVVKLRGKKLKVIVESGILTDDELKRCCALYGRFNIDFLKTSTGFAASGATVHAVRIMKEHLPPHIAIKASGGIRNYTFAKELIDAGATRIGTSASMQILREAAAAGD